MPFKGARGSATWHGQDECRRRSRVSMPFKGARGSATGPEFNEGHPYFTSQCPSRGRGGLQPSPASRYLRSCRRSQCPSRGRGGLQPLTTIYLFPPGKPGVLGAVCLTPLPAVGLVPKKPPIASRKIDANLCSEGGCVVCLTPLSDAWIDGWDQEAVCRSPRRFRAASLWPLRSMTSTTSKTGGTALARGLSRAIGTK